MIVTSCCECNGTMAPRIVAVTGHRNGEEFPVSVPGWACDTCGHQTIDNQQSGEFTKAVSDAYRRAHGLLTGPEIRERREEWLRMSQQAFAEHLGVGSASVKRWEAGQVQDRAMDELIRLKTDPEAARNNLRALEFQVPEEHVLSSIRIGDQDLDLSFLLEQHFTNQPRMKMGRLRLDSALDDEEPLAA